MPPFDWADFGRIVSNPDRAALSRAIDVGEAATWRKVLSMLTRQISLIRNHVKIEYTLEECLRTMRKKVYAAEEQARHEIRWDEMGDDRR